MTLDLTDVAGLTLDSQAANLRLGTITLHSDGTARFTIINLQRGTEVLRHGRVVARAGRSGTVNVTIASGTTVLKLVRPGHAARRHSRSKKARSRTRGRRTVRFTG